MMNFGHLLEWVVSFLIILGGAFALVGSWGLARLPSFMTRLHGPTKATTLGVGSCLIGSLIYFPGFQGTASAHELLIALFLFITAPVSANMMAKAHLHRKWAASNHGSPETTEQALPDAGEGVGWATFCPATQEDDQTKEGKTDL